jgi:hypothetical protein
VLPEELLAGWLAGWLAGGGVSAVVTLAIGIVLDRPADGQVSGDSLRLLL